MYVALYQPVYFLMKYISVNCIHIIYVYFLTKCQDSFVLLSFFLDSPHEAVGLKELVAQMCLICAQSFGLGVRTLHTQVVSSPSKSPIEQL